MTTKRIIAVDVAKEGCEDCSTITTFCGSCRQVLKTKTYAPEINGMWITIYKNVRIVA